MQFRYSLGVVVISGLMLLTHDSAGGQQVVDTPLKAGAASVDVSPIVLPAIRNGGFLEARSDRVDDPLFARALVLSSGDETIAICIVDSCMIPTDVCDRIKSLVHDQCEIAMDRILISATHTHTAPSTMNMCLGTRRDERYTEQVIPQIARSIILAHERLEPAKIGWNVVNAAALTNCRRWITRRDRMGIDPFGQRTIRAMMHPGYLNPDYVCPAGPIDPWLTVIGVVAQENNRPICVMGNFSMHYFGAGPGFSADYFGLVAEGLEKEFGNTRTEEDSAFVGIMSQGTSGDLHWMNYSQPRRNTNRQEYADAISAKILEALEGIEYSSDVPIAMAESRLDLERRLPSNDRLEWAASLNEPRGDRVPNSREEVYAQQATWIDRNPRAKVVLQAIRIGDLGINALPNEVYGLTGLRLKAQSPFATTFNLELANGATGYIPPPHQHKLGGYTTWPARTAGLEEMAEPIIVEELLGLLEDLSGQERRVYVDPPSELSRLVMQMKPIAYWRLGDLLEDRVVDEVGTIVSSFDGVHARYLNGPQGDGLNAHSESNRCTYFVDARLKANFTSNANELTVALWFWNGLPAELSAESMCLIAKNQEGSKTRLMIAGLDATSHTGRLTLRLDDETSVGKSVLAAKAWHHVAMVESAQGIAIYLDGESEPEIWIERSSIEGQSRASDSVSLSIGGEHDASQSFDGKLDEVAVFLRALSEEEMATLYRCSGMTQPELPAYSDGFNRKQSDSESLVEFAEVIQEAEPTAYWRMHENEGVEARNEMQSGFASYEGAAMGLPPSSQRANFGGGRLNAEVESIEDTYSVEFWFRNDLAVRARPVTGYMFCRGADGATGAPGDSLGIGGTHSWTGCLFVYNGNEREEAVAGTTQLVPGRWNHVVYVRDGEQVRAYLNGNPKPEFEGKLPITYPENDSQFFIGGRNDNFANFQGMIEEVALYDRVLTPEEVVSHFTAANVAKWHEETVEPIRELEPTSANDSLELIHVPDGYRVELVASEPHVVDPVAIDWGHDGKLWVVEMSDYPLGLDGEGLAGGRIKYLEDLDGDGTYDTSTLFADELSFPTGILAWRSGVIVTAAPEILYLEDKDGDGRADSRTTLYSGFLEGNQQLRVNGLRWGLDNWIHCASGSHHAGYGKDSRIRSHRTNSSHQIGSRDFRIRPDSGEIDPQSGPSQYGRNRDDWGNWFGVQNSHPLWHYVLQDHDIRRNPNFAPPNPKNQVITPANPPVYPASRLQKRFHSFEQSGRFTSACSAMIYRDDLLFDRDHHQHAFTCEPFHNLVQHNLIAEDGVSFSFERPTSEGEYDFFASEDRWCRPVMARTGPDGALWVVDMYRYMIEHPQWLPENGKDELRPHYRLGDQHGRIYRIVPVDSVPRPIPHLDGLTTKELVAMLESTNGNVRDIAQRLLIQDADPSAPAFLQSLVETTESPLAHLHALCTLEGLNALTWEMIESGLANQHAGVRRQAVRLATALPFDPRLVQVMNGESSEKVILQLATTLGAFQDPLAAKALAKIVVNYQEDKYIVAAAMSSLNRNNVSEVFRQVAESMFERGPQTVGFFELLDELLAQTIAMGTEQDIASVALFTAGLGSGTIEPLHDELLARVLQSFRRHGIALEELPDETRVLISERLASARATVGKRDGRIEGRVAAAALLLQQASHRETDLSLMRELLSARTSIVLQQAVVNRCSETNDPAVFELLVSGWASHSPSLRESILTILPTREIWADSLLELIESGAFSVADLSPANRNAFIQTAPDSTKERWNGLFSASIGRDRNEVISRYRSSSEIDGNLDRGQALFKDQCANCHRFKDIGKDVGPDLAALTDRSNEKLLSSILDPNAVVEAKYVSYVATDVDGRVYTGIITSETASSITMVSNEGDESSILRTDIDELRSTGQSLMPTGLEEELSPQDMADLLQFLQE